MCCIWVQKFNKQQKCPRTLTCKTAGIQFSPSLSVSSLSQFIPIVCAAAAKYLWRHLQLLSILEVPAFLLGKKNSYSLLIICSNCLFLGYCSPNGSTEQESGLYLAEIGSQTRDIFNCQVSVSLSFSKTKQLFSNIVLLHYALLVL